MSEKKHEPRAQVDCFAFDFGSPGSASARIKALLAIFSFFWERCFEKIAKNGVKEKKAKKLFWGKTREKSKNWRKKSKAKKKQKKAILKNKKP
ncbi:MAG: hypothetical protein NTW59_01560 [Candidatus Diapherotrites archaeon]|nr:hypothetical protein [Candidatus Diapherotrites archaeon]